MISVTQAPTYRPVTLDLPSPHAERVIGLLATASGFVAVSQMVDTNDPNACPVAITLPILANVPLIGAFTKVATTNTTATGLFFLERQA